MKRTLTLLLSCILVLMMTACGNAIAQKRVPSMPQDTEEAMLDVPAVTGKAPGHTRKSPDTTVDLPNANASDSPLNSVMDELRSKIDLSGKLSFSAQTPSGEKTDSSIFSGYDLTMINIWGTLCKPCIEEMPDIQKLYEDMTTERVNVIGFVSNYQDDRVEKAQEILTAKGITYSNVVFDDEISGAIYAQIPGFPTTIFVDSEGNVIGDQVSGAHSYEEYKTIIIERLEECMP